MSLVFLSKTNIKWQKIAKTKNVLKKAYVRFSEIKR